MLYARDSLLGKDPEESRTVISLGQADGSASIEDGEGTITSDLGVHGLAFGISQPRPTTSIHATDDYCQMQ